MSALVPHSRPTLGAEEAEAVRQVVLSGKLVQGKEVAAFEEEMAAFAERRFAVAVSSGTAALHLALLALETGPGDEVIVPSYVCTALLHAVLATGATPVVGDIDPLTRNLNPEQVRARTGERSRAVILPHMFGLPAPIEPFTGSGLPVVEDCAMSIGARQAGRMVGSLGTLSICSFYATKMMATGEGGMVLTDDPGLAEGVRGRREYDGLPASHLRFNYKMTDMAAALGRVQLKRLPDFVERRRAIAARYSRSFAGSGCELPLDSPEHIYYRYLLGAPSGAGSFIEDLEREGVAGRRPIDRLPHRELGGADGEFPNAVRAAERDVSLPLYPALSGAEIERVIRAVQKISH